MNLQVTMLGDRRAPSPDALLASATRNLRACAAFGLAERFDDSIAYMARELNWPEVEWESRNVTQGRPRAGDLAPGLVERIRGEAALDAALHADAVELFERRVRGG